ncbi:MAG: hypothetical protein ACK482_13290, partial [Aphanizomenon sp.]
YREAFIDFFTNLSKVSKQTIDLDKLGKMSDHWFAALTDKFIGKNCSEIEFNSSVAKLFESLMNEFKQDSFL